MSRRLAALTAMLAVVVGCQVPDPGPGDAAGISSDPAAGYVVAADLSYGSLPGQQLDVYLPGEPLADRRPALLWLHGGAWVWSSRTALVTSAPYVLQLATRLDAVVVAVGFRLAPLSLPRPPSDLRPAVRLNGVADGEVPVAVQVDDITRAVVWLRDNAAWFGIEPDRLVLIGDSSGAHLATLAAYSGTAWSPNGPPPGWPGRGAPGVRAVVTTAVPTDLAALAATPTDVLGVPLHSLVEAAAGCGLAPCDAELLDALDPARWVGPASPATWLVAGSLDTLSPPFQSERLVAALERVVPPGTVAYDLVDSGPPEWQTHQGIKLGMNLAALAAWLDVLLR